MRVADKTVLITGASVGIGKATAEKLAQNGARLILAARSVDKLEQLKASLIDQYQADVHVLPLDVSKRNHVADALASLPETWCEIDVLVNNAGLALGIEKIYEADLDDYDTMIDVNVKGLIYVSHHILKGMVERNRGHVVNIGSISSFSTYPGGSVYCATKYAVRALSEGMKMDVHGSPIRITEIDPGAVDTEFSLVRFKGDQDRAANVYRGYEPLHAQDIADAIFYALNAPEHVDVRQVFVTCTAQTATLLQNKSS